MSLANPIVPIILAGGTGSRLWPLSRQSFPKQFLKLLENNNYTLLQQTYKRIENLKNISEPIIICNEEHRFIVGEQMQIIKVNPLSIILEPIGKNTAPAIAIAALKAIEFYNEKDIEPILLVLSSDHEIKDHAKFIEVINKGLEFSKNNKLVTFGVVPQSPETGYGYIKAEKAINSYEVCGYKIAEFIEKPNYKKACELAKDNRFTWNSGMFLFKAKIILKELERFCPEILDCCEKSINKSKYDLDFQRLDKKEFDKCPNISIDVGVMEKTSDGFVIPLNAGWSDIGSWESIWDNSTKNNDNNVLKGNVLLKDTQNSYFRSEERLIVGIGLENLIVVETNDAILISDKSKSQKVKEMVNLLLEKKISAGREHQKIYRPWGHYLSVVEKEKWQVKLIFVKQGESLSLQKHKYRSEHWIVVSGTAQVEINNDKKIISENQSTYIPLGAKHRLSNPGEIPLILIEVQSGSYIGEDDIIRFEDKYGR